MDSTPCEHFDGANHSKVTFSYVADQDELMKYIEDQQGKPIYVALYQDLILDRQIANLASGSTICLNGHNLIIKKGKNVFMLAQNNTINFCDCGNEVALERGTKLYFRNNN